MSTVTVDLNKQSTNYCRINKPHFHKCHTVASPILEFKKIAAAPSRVDLGVFKAQSGFVT